MRHFSTLRISSPRYCSLLHFKALMTGLSVIEPQTALSSIRAMRELCKADSESNPALQLAAFLFSAAIASCRYLIFLTAPSLAAYSNRLSHLIGGSMVKQACGIIPVSGNVPRITKGIRDSAAVVFLTFAGDETRSLTKKWRHSALPEYLMSLSRSHRSWSS